MKNHFQIIWISLCAQFSFFAKLFTKSGRKELEIDDINDKLRTAIIDQSREKRQLKSKIVKNYNRKNSGRSKFIPRKRKSKEKVRAEIIGKHREEMKAVNLKLTKDLDFK